MKINRCICCHSTISISYDGSEVEEEVEDICYRCYRIGAQKRSR